MINKDGDKILKYFIPEWDDRVDPEYRFITDTHSRKHSQDPLRNDVYMWDIFGVNRVPFDGLIVSRMKIMENKRKYKQIVDEGIHEFLRLPKTFEIMGDCGAWGYIDQDEPPFKSSEVLDYYVKCGFNYGVSIDHLIVPAYSEQNEKRWQLTLDNAKEMFELWQSKDRYLNSIRMIGIAQGWDVSSYRKAVRELLKIGYDYIGLGGLARAPTGTKFQTSESKTVLNVVKGTSLEVCRWMKETKKKVDVHVFGFARPDIIGELIKCGVTSFDSASFLRRAWLGVSSNYYTLNGQGYTALRVRFQKEDASLKTLEQESLKKIRLFTKNQISKEDVIEALVEYEMKMLEDEIHNRTKEVASIKEAEEKVRWILEGNRLSNGETEKLVEKLQLEKDAAMKVKSILQRAVTGITRIQNLRKHYDRTLTDRPWEKCDCPICRDVGVEVIIFRGNNRNRRRGFHNTYAFYQKLGKIFPRILVFTNCTMKKNKTPNLIQASERYCPSSPFKVFWNNVFDLPVEIAILSAKFGLIDWSKRIPDYDYKMQKSDVPKLVEELEEKLKRYDKIFFIGLGLYRNVAERVKEGTGFYIDIFPKMELTDRGKLDIIEYTKQMKFFRKAIIQTVPEKCRPSQEGVKISSWPTLDKFVKT